MRCKDPSHREGGTSQNCHLPGHWEGGKCHNCRLPGHRGRVVDFKIAACQGHRDCDRCRCCHLPGHLEGDRCQNCRLPGHRKSASHQNRRLSNNLWRRVSKLSRLCDRGAPRARARARRGARRIQCSVGRAKQLRWGGRLKVKTAVCQAIGRVAEAKTAACHTKREVFAAPRGAQ